MLRLFGAVLLVLCAGCSSTSGQPAPLLADSLLLKPVDRGRVSSGFGLRHHPILKRRQMHRGIDWAAPRGTAVRAAGHGVVVAAGPLGSYGRYLRIDHGGTLASAYAHLERFAPGLRKGHLVRQGDLIGRVGSSGRATGPHLHYEVLVGGRQVDPLAVAPKAVAQLPDESPHATAAGVTSELAIGGPDLAAEVSPGDPNAPAHRDERSLVLEAPGAVIRTEDLLRLAR